MKNNKQLVTPKVGMRIKIAIPSYWATIDHRKEKYWWKGRIIKVNNENDIIISCKVRRKFTIRRMECFRDKETGTFYNIIQAL